MIVYPLLHENRPRTSAQPQHGERWQLSCQPHGKLKPFKINNLQKHPAKRPVQTARSCEMHHAICQQAQSENSGRP
ncbi:hypothetical protein, partial [Pseudomonas aeruginosa]|uniref:hypothetical protein n=1 Tax=Pseudomonas aeruginosa TaxID=287 RepID=UPI001968F5D0